MFHGVDFYIPMNDFVPWRTDLRPEHSARRKIEFWLIWCKSFFCCERLSASMARSLHLRFSLCSTSDSHPSPGGSRTAAGCQPQA